MVKVSIMSCPCLRRRRPKGTVSSSEASSSGSGSGLDSEMGEDSSEDDFLEGDDSEGRGRGTKQRKATGSVSAAAAKKLDSLHRIIAERTVDGIQEFRVKYKGALHPFESPFGCTMS